MIFPLSDSPNPKGIPFITYLLIAVNVLFYVLITVPQSVTPADPSDPAVSAYVDVVRQHASERAVQAELAHLSAYDLFLFRHGFRPVAPNLEALFLSLFLHGGFLHLSGNMLFLWIYGDNVEYRLGPLRYLLAYLGSGVAATLFHAALFSTSALPLVGASGAISGVLGFYFVWFPRNRVRLLMLFVPFFMRVIEVPARLVLGFFLVIDNLLPLLVSGGSNGTGVAFGAHIGGFFAGLAGGWLFDRRTLAAPATFRTVALAAGSPADLIRSALDSGETRAAAVAYFQQPSGTNSADAETTLRLADALRDAGDASAALTVYRRHIRDHPDDPSAAAAHLGAGLVQLDLLSQPTAAYHHFLEALGLPHSPDVSAQAREGLARIAARQKLNVGRRLP